MPTQRHGPALFPAMGMTRLTRARLFLADPDGMRRSVGLLSFHGDS